MRVLYISGGDYKYGAPKSMMTMLEGLREAYNIEVILLTKKRNVLNEYCDQHGIENYSFWYHDIMAGSPYSNKLLTIAKHLVKYLAYLLGNVTMGNVNKLPIDFSTIDIIHSNTNRQDIGAYIASKYNSKHIWHIREMGREDYNVIFYKKNCIQYMNQNADAFIMISNCVKEKWESIGIDSQKVHVVYNGIDVEKIQKCISNKAEKIRMVITGHVQPGKGQLQLVQAIAGLPLAIRDRVELDIIGEAYGDYKRKIEAIVQKEQLYGQIHFLGYQKNINTLLSKYDIGVTCSKAEGFGRCTVEYMLAGLLTIASDTGANHELIQDKETGVLYHYNDTKHLSRIILWAIENQDERRKIAEEGRRVAEQKFSKEQYVKNIYEVYKKCLTLH